MQFGGGNFDAVCKSVDIFRNLRTNLNVLTFCPFVQIVGICVFAHEIGLFVFLGGGGGVASVLVMTL
jgi:hypothetical protein